MSSSSDVHVYIDDRVRLMSTVYALTRSIDEEHARRPHSAHAHARATRKQFAHLSLHPAVTALQTLLDRGAPLEAVFGYALRLKPGFVIDAPPNWATPGWNDQLTDFDARANTAAWWGDGTEKTAWEKSQSEAARLFRGVNLHPFLQPYVGSTSVRFTFMPNILYPANHEVGVRVGDEITCIAPPRPAWGDSPPWPFDEDAGHLFLTSIGTYVRILMSDLLRTHADQLTAAEKVDLPVSEAVRTRYPSWRDQLFALLTSGMVAIYLEDHLDPAEAKAFTMMENRLHGLAVLPAVVSVLRRYVQDQMDGKYATFVDFLPLFPKQIRVAKRIYAL
jgi:hypothetical protein